MIKDTKSKQTLTNFEVWCVHNSAKIGSRLVTACLYAAQIQHITSGLHCLMVTSSRQLYLQILMDL